MKVLDVRALSGVQWIKLAWTNHFAKAPAAWISLVAAWLVITLGMLLIPILGQLAANVLQPVFFAGFMLICRAQERGEAPQVSGLFSAFRSPSLRALIIVGCVLLVGEIVILLGLSAMGFPELKVTPDGKGFDFVSFRADMEGKEWMVLLFVAVSATFKGGLWFTAPLLAFHNMTAMHAIRWSIYAFLSNFGALLAFGALLTVMYMVVVLTYGLGLIIALPLTAISNYTGYRAIFAEEETKAAETAETAP
jgi:uncharacterized membrane protein